MSGSTRNPFDLPAGLLGNVFSFLASASLMALIDTAKASAQKATAPQEQYFRQRLNREFPEVVAANQEQKNSAAAEEDETTALSLLQRKPSNKRQRTEVVSFQTQYKTTYQAQYATFTPQERQLITLTKRGSLQTFQTLFSQARPTLFPTERRLRHDFTYRKFMHDLIDVLVRKEYQDFLNFLETVLPRKQIEELTPHLKEEILQEAPEEGLHGWQPLEKLILWGRLNQRELIQKRLATARKENKHIYLYAALLGAIEHGNMACVQHFFQHYPEEAQHALHYIFTALLYDNVLDYTTERYGSLLHLAARRGATPIAQFLLEQKADANKRSYLQKTALHEAADNGQLSTTQCLLAFKANVQAPDTQSATALHKAKSGAVMRCLIESKADIHARDFLQRTPLHMAVYNGEEAVQCLLDHKAYPVAHDARGITALDLAMQENQTKLMQLLQAAATNNHAPDPASLEFDWDLEMSPAVDPLPAAALLPPLPHPFTAAAAVAFNPLHGTTFTFKPPGS